MQFCTETLMAKPRMTVWHPFVYRTTYYRNINVYMILQKIHVIVNKLSIAPLGINVRKYAYIQTDR